MTHTVPPYLNEGDKVKIVASASRLPNGNLAFAVELLQSWGLIVEMDPAVMLKDGMFAGSNAQRLQSVQNALDDESIQAIFFARGGYGSLRIIEEINWTKFNLNPKWLIGFSDVCTFHLPINNTLKIASLHAGMPIQFESLGEDHLSLTSIRDFLFRQNWNRKFESSQDNVHGICTGVISGGNLSIIYSLLYSENYTNFDGNILFIEEIGEYHYTIDRMLRALRNSLRFEKIRGILVGDFSGTKESNLAFELSIPEIIKDVFGDLNIPIAFNIAAGHEELNVCLPFGVRMNLLVDINGTKLKLDSVEATT